MSSNSDNATALAENKVLILYILNLIDGDIIQDGLFKIISSINNVNYFYFKQVLTDLIDSKLVGVNTKEEEQVIRITSEGKNAYILTKDVLPGIMKLKADNIFKTEYSNIEEECSVIAEFIQKNEKQYIVRLNLESESSVDDKINEIREILGADADISVEFVNDIPVLASGKRKPVICEWKNKSL